MTYDNKHTDKKLQELEYQSLPDLSRMDEHWTQMTGLLQPVAQPAKPFFSKKIFLSSLAAVVMLATFFFIYYKIQQPKKDQPVNEITVNGNPGKPVVNDPAPADTPLIIKTHAIVAKDTGLKVISLSAAKKLEINKIRLESFYEELQKKSQSFQINNKRDTIIYGKEGTRLYIPANSFDVTGAVTLLLTEYYSIQDMIMNKLTTTSNGVRLITGGMIYLDAVDKNQNLVDLKKDASVRLDMPKKDNQAPMRLFYGNEYYRNDVTEIIDSINWIPTDRIFTDAKPNLAESDKIGVISTKPIRLIPESNDDYGKERMIIDTIAKTLTVTRSAIINDSSMTSRFGVNVFKLGYINCDRFNNDPRPKTELIVDLGDNPDYYYTVLVLDKLNSLVPVAGKNGNTIRFGSLPEGETGRIISLGIMKDKPVTSVQKVIISKATVIKLTFEEVTPYSFRDKLGR